VKFFQAVLSTPAAPFHVRIARQLPAPVASLPILDFTPFGRLVAITGVIVVEMVPKPDRVLNDTLRAFAKRLPIGRNVLVFFDTTELAKQMHQTFSRRRARDVIVRPPEIAEQNAVVKFAEKWLIRQERT